jgi:prepilin-type N-terminal cleavage/methylation domain-containing protein
MKHGFTLVEVMFANAMLLILVAGFAKKKQNRFLSKFSSKCSKMNWPHIWMSGLWQS